MRNLLVHLRGRGTDELRRIADCWDVALTGRADADHVAQLYRTLRDPWVVRDRVEALSNAEWAIIEAILASTPPPTPEALPALVALDPAAVTAALDALRGCGILATEPAAPLELPRELATAFRRVQEEQLLGPGLGPETPLRALLTTLEGGELEEAAEAWGLRATPGTIGREALIDEILARVELPEQRRVVVRALPPGAGQVFGAIREAGGRQVLAALRADLKLGRPLLREAARVLNRRLLAWPTWDDAVGRSLIVPSDILAPRRPPRDAPPPLAEVAATPLPRPTYLYSAAWDLLTILQRLSQRTLEWRDGDEERNVTASRRLAPALWNGLLDTNRARQGYVPFLLVLALDEGLVRIEEERYVEHGPALEPWRGRSFPEQTRALLRRWRRAPDWPEGPSQEDLQLANVDWPGAREAVLSELRACVVGTWYDAIQLALRIARLRPSLLGGSFSAARASGPAGTREEVTVAAIEVLLHGALVPLGLLVQGSYMRGKREEAAVALTPIGSWLLGRGEEPAPAPRGDRALTVGADFEILLLQPAPRRIWALGAIAELIRLDTASVYRLGEASVRRGLADGLTAAQIITLLERGGRAPLPQNVAFTIGEWLRGHAGVRLTRALILRPDDPATVERLILTLTRAGMTTPETLPDGRLLITIATDRDAEAVLATLREAGLSPHWLR